MTASLKRLEKKYDSLTRRERAVLCHLAICRDDQSEFQRLCDAAPREYWSSPDHRMEMNALSTIAFCYLIEQLGHALCFWYASGNSALGLVRGERDPDGYDFNDRIGNIAAYLYVVNAEAYRQFCDELGISVKDLTGGTLYQWILDLCDENMPNMTLTAEKLTKRIRELGKSGDLVTVESTLKRIWNFYHAFATARS